jgi:hypothetical protein
MKNDDFSEFILMQLDSTLVIGKIVAYRQRPGGRVQLGDRQREANLAGKVGYPEPMDELWPQPEVRLAQRRKDSPRTKIPPRHSGRRARAIQD